MLREELRTFCNYTVSQKTIPDTDVAHSNFDAHQPILVIFWECLRCCQESILSNDEDKSELIFDESNFRVFKMLHGFRIVLSAKYMFKLIAIVSLTLC